MKLTPSPVQKRAEELGIPVRFPKSLKKPEEQQEFRALNADVAVVCAYGLILPQAVLEAPGRGCINVHASLLPRWRGAAPIQRAIQAGDDKTGITIMQMDVGLDTGDMLLKGEVQMTPTTTAGTLHDALSVMGADLIIKVLDNMPTPMKQPTDGVTYAEKIKKEEALINWSLAADQIERNIRAFNPYPGAYFMYKGERIKVFDAAVEAGSGTFGTLLDDGLLVACGQGAIRLKKLQREGKKPVDAKDFLNGLALKKGDSVAV